MAEREEVTDRERDPGCVVVDHRRHLVAGQRAVHEHHREAERAAAGEHRVAQRRGREDRTLDAARREPVERLARTRRVVVGVGDDCGIARRHQRRLDPAQDQREDRVRHVGDQDADGRRAAGAEARGDRVGGVAEPPGEPFDALRHRRADEAAGAGIQHPRHGRGVDARRAGNVLNRRPFVGHQERYLPARARVSLSCCKRLHKPPGASRPGPRAGRDGRQNARAEASFGPTTSIRTTAGTGRCRRRGTPRSTSRSGSTSAGCTTTGSRARAPRWRNPASARCSASTSTTSATRRAP